MEEPELVAEEAVVGFKIDVVPTNAVAIITFHTIDLTAEVPDGRVMETPHLGFQLQHLRELRDALADVVKTLEQNHSQGRPS